MTQNRLPVFQDLRLARLLITEMRCLHDAAQIDSLAWVVMPDHLHWLVSLEKTPLNVLMQQLKSKSAVSINRAIANRHGRLWQKGFHDHAIRHEENLLSVARYVVANPLRAGLVQKIGDYPHWDAKWL